MSKMTEEEKGMLEIRNGISMIFQGYERLKKVKNILENDKKEKTKNNRLPKKAKLISLADRKKRSGEIE